MQNNNNDKLHILQYIQFGLIYQWKMTQISYYIGSNAWKFHFLNVIVSKNFAEQALINFWPDNDFFVHKYEFARKIQIGEGFDSCDRPSNLTQIGFKSLIFQPLWPWNLMNDLEKQ